METGRKFWITIVGLMSAQVSLVIALFLGKVVPDAFFGAQTTMVLAFCGANAASTFAFTRSAASNDTTITQVTKQITDRRDAMTGTEPT